MLTSNGAQLSESDRDQIDAHAEQIIKSCKETIVMFRVETDKHKAHPQVKEHRNAVMLLLESYLKGMAVKKLLCATATLNEQLNS